ncbi:MAG: AEC family transporter [Neomegalonema sp.]|nr:AEC family transporter [Neomegalonema sp.]
MLQVLQVVIPVFLVIGAGYGAVRAGLFADSAIDGLLAFTVRFSVPVLLFTKIYALDLGQAFNWPMLASFYVGALTCFALGLGIARLAGRTPGEAVVIGFGAFFSNTVLIGLPVMGRAYGEAATEPVYGIIAFHAPTLYTIGMIAMEMSRRGGAGAVAALKRAGKSIVSNALMIGILTGVTLNLIQAPLPEPFMNAANLLAGAALPAALFAMGAALTRYKLQAEITPALGLSALLLILHPLIAYIGAALIFDLEDQFVRAAVLTSAMPAGMNVYVFAALYRRAEGVAASTVLLSTALGVLTISFWLTLLGGAGSG